MGFEQLSNKGQKWVSGERILEVMEIIHKQITMENQELTFGQKAVGLNFNHAEGIVNQQVHKAKVLSAELIDLVEEVNDSNNNNSIASWAHSVFRTAAFNALIAAQMAVVKFITWHR